MALRTPGLTNRRPSTAIIMSSTRCRPAIGFPVIFYLYPFPADRRGINTFTQFGYTCKQLGIAICTSSMPQVKVWVDRRSCLKYHNHYYQPLDKNGHPVYFCKGTTVMVIKALDGKLYAPSTTPSTARSDCQIISRDPLHLLRYVCRKSLKRDIFPLCAIHGNRPSLRSM